MSAETNRILIKVNQLRNPFLDHIKVLNWFSELPLDVMQDTAKSLYTFLKSFGGIKERKGTQCGIKPCRANQYSRGVCQKHYQLFKRLASHPKIGWIALGRLGLIKPTRAELAEFYAKQFSLPRADDPLRVLIRRSKRKP